MTTIAYKHDTKTIAWDSRQTGDGGVIKSDKSDKHIEIDGVHFWICGVVSDEKLMISAYENGFVEKSPECNAFVYDDGVVYRCGVDEEGILWKEGVNSDDAFGSGYLFALSEMRLGLSAKEAVEHAKTLDCYTGGEVHAMELEG